MVQSFSNLLLLLSPPLAAMAMSSQSASSPPRQHRLAQEEQKGDERYEILSSAEILERMQKMVSDYPDFASLTTTQEWFGLPRAGECHIDCRGANSLRLGRSLFVSFRDPTSNACRVSCLFMKYRGFVLDSSSSNVGHILMSSVNFMITIDVSSPQAKTQTVPSTRTTGYTTRGATITC